MYSVKLYTLYTIVNPYKIKYIVHFLIFFFTLRIGTFVVSPTEGLPSTKSAPPAYQPPTSTPTTASMSPAYTSSSTPVTSPPAIFPAVLVGSKQKVPPPVPPRGTPKSKRADGKGVPDCSASSFQVDSDTLVARFDSISSHSKAAHARSISISGISKGHVSRVVAQFNRASSPKSSPFSSKKCLKYSDIEAFYKSSSKFERFV